MSIDFNTNFMPSLNAVPQTQDWGLDFAKKLTGDIGGTSVPAPVATASTDPSLIQSLLGYTDAKGIQHQGNLVPGMQALGGLTQSWLGFKNLGLAKDQFNFQKGAFNDQYNQQVQTYNTSLTDRANSRGYLTDAQKANYISQNSLEGRG